MKKKKPISSLAKIYKDAFQRLRDSDNNNLKKCSPLADKLLYETNILGYQNFKDSETQVGGDHYKGMAIQPAEFCTKNNIGYLEGAVIKYICRYKKKNGKQDLEKAIHCIQLLIEYNYKNL